MTRDEALELLRGGPEGVKKWNQWREENLGGEIPSLDGAELDGAHLVEGAELFEANLEEADLRRAHFEGATLCRPPCEVAGVQPATG